MGENGGRVWNRTRAESGTDRVTEQAASSEYLGWASPAVFRIVPKHPTKLKQMIAEKARETNIRKLFNSLQHAVLNTIYVLREK